MVWNTATWQAVRTHSLPGPSPQFAALSPDGKTLAVGRLAAPSGESTLALFDAATLEPREQVAGVAQAVGRLAFAPDGKTLVVSCVAGGASHVIVCDADSGREIRRLELGVPASGLALSPDGKLLAAGTRDGTIVLWDPKSGASRGTFAAHAALVARLAYAPDGRTLASATFDGMIKLWWVGK
jgi:WD40 repeat protein